MYCADVALCLRASIFYSTFIEPLCKNSEAVEFLVDRGLVSLLNDVIATLVTALVSRSLYCKTNSHIVLNIFCRTTSLTAQMAEWYGASVS